MDKLIRACLKEGTSHKERGNKASLQRLRDEVVLLFQVDNDEARQAFGIGRACDLAFFYMKHRERPRLLFVELKGRHITDAVEQLRQTIIGAKRFLFNITGNTFPLPDDMRAIVVRTGASPRIEPTLQRRFQAATAIELQFTRDSDLRPFV